MSLQGSHGWGWETPRQQEFGLQVGWTSDYNTVTLSPGAIYDSDETTRMVVTTQLTAAMSGMGGSEPTNALAYPWLGVDAAGAPSFWLDTSLSSPTLTPAGIVAKRYIGPALRNDASQNLDRFSSVRAGRSVSLTYKHNNAVVYATGDFSTAVAFSVAPFVPTTATSILLMLNGSIAEATGAYREFQVFADVGLTHTLATSGTSSVIFAQNAVSVLVPTAAVTLTSLYYHATVSDACIGIIVPQGFTEVI